MSLLINQWLPGLLLLLLIPAAAQTSEKQLRATKLAENVHLLATGNPGNGNLVVLTGSDGALLVDSHYAALSESLTIAVAAIHSQPIRFVVNTHWHPDHTGGNERLQRAGAVVIAHENARKRMAAGQTIEFFDAKVPPSSEGALAQWTVSNELTTHLNGERVRILYPGPAHTDGDLIIWFSKANVVHLGDLFLNGNYPFVDLSSGGDVAGQLAILEKVIAETDEQTKIVPGHGPLATRMQLKAWHKMFTTVWTRVQTAVKQGQSLEHILTARPTAEFDANWNTPAIPREGFIKVLYNMAMRSRR